MAEEPSQKQRMSFWGIGPAVSTVTIVWAALAGAATYVWPEWFAFGWPPYPALLAIGLVLFAVGIVFQAISGRALMKAYNQDRLVTSGVYRVCRNPLYANIIITLLPSLALLCDSWLMLTSSIVMYVLTRIEIRCEEAYLEERYGQEYLDYRRRTNAIFPTICRR